MTTLINSQDVTKTYSKLQEFIQDYLGFAEKFPLNNVLDNVWESYHPTTWLHDLRVAVNRIQQITKHSQVDPKAVLGCQINLSVMLLFQAKLLQTNYDEVKQTSTDYAKAYDALDQQMDLLNDKIRFLETKSRHLIKENQMLRDEKEDLSDKLLDAAESIKHLKSREKKLTEALQTERNRNYQLITSAKEGFSTPLRSRRATQDSFANGFSPRQSWSLESPSDNEEIHERQVQPTQSCESLVPPIQSRSSLRSSRVQDKKNYSPQSPTNQSPSLSFLNESPIPCPTAELNSEKNRNTSAKMTNPSQFTKVMQSFLSDTQQLQINNKQRHKSMIVPKRVKTLAKVSEGRHASFNSPLGIEFNFNTKSDSSQDSSLSSIEHRNNAKLQLTRNQQNVISPDPSLKYSPGISYQFTLDQMSSTEARAVAEAIHQISIGEFVWKSSRSLLGQEKRSLRYLVVDPQTKMVSWSKRGITNEMVPPDSESSVFKERRLNLRSFVIRAIRVISDPISPNELPDSTTKLPNLSIVLESNSPSKAVKFKLVNLNRHDIWELALRHLHLASRTSNSPHSQSNLLHNLAKRNSFLFRRNRW